MCISVETDLPASTVLLLLGADEPRGFLLLVEKLVQISVIWVISL